MNLPKANRPRPASRATPRRPRARAWLLAAVFCGAAQAQEAPLEYQVKASYLYNFIRFITWPRDAFRDGDSLNLCVTGADRFGSALNSFAGESIDGHPIRVHRLSNAAEPRGVRCHVFFVSAAQALPAALSPERGTLTVGETRGFLERGGIINLVEVQGRIRFEINQKAAQQAGLAMSSRLLSLAMERQ